MGDTIWIRTPGNITMATYAKHATITYQDLAPTKESFVVDDASYFAFLVDDIDQAQNDISAIDAYTAEAAIAMSNAVETKIIATATANLLGSNTISAAASGTAAAPGTVTVTAGAVTAIALGTAGSGYGTSPPVVTITGGGGRGARAHAVLTAGAVSSYVVDDGGSGYTSAPTATVAGGKPIVLDSTTTAATGIYNQFVAARAKLSNNNVPTQGRWALIDPDTTSLLLNDTSHFIRSTSLGDRAVTEGNLGNGTNLGPGHIGWCAGFAVYETPHLATSTIGGTAAKTLLFGDDLWIAYAAVLRETEALRLQTTFATAVRGLLIHDATILDEATKRGVGVIAAA